jgi:hypothetical protein
MEMMKAKKRNPPKTNLPAGHGERSTSRHIDLIKCKQMSGFEPECLDTLSILYSI